MLRWRAKQAFRRRNYGEHDLPSRDSTLVATTRLRSVGEKGHAPNCAGVDEPAVCIRRFRDHSCWEARLAFPATRRTPRIQ